MDYTEIGRPMPIECHEALNAMEAAGEGWDGPGDNPAEVAARIRREWDSDAMMDASVLRVAIGEELVDRIDAEIHGPHRMAG